MSNYSQLEIWRQTPQDKRLAISSIRVTAPAAGLRRIPAGFYVSVEVNGIVLRTNVKAEVPSSNVVQWDQFFLLPAVSSARVILRIFAAFEFERLLGRGQLMHEAELTVGELLRHSNHFLPILFSPHASEPPISLLVKVERGLEGEPDATQFGQSYSPGSKQSLRLGQMTDIGLNLLACYRRTQCISDYHAATEQLRLTLDSCGSDDPDRAAALSNLADVFAIHPHIEESDSIINAPISLYREALGLRQSGHPDHSLTLLKLGFALLYRFQLRKDPVDLMEGQDLLNRAQDIRSDHDPHIRPVIGTTPTTTPKSHRSSLAPALPPSPLPHISTDLTTSQPHRFPECTADISTRCSPSMRSKTQRPAERSGDERQSAPISWHETQVSPAACRFTQPQPPHPPPVILNRERCARSPATPVDTQGIPPQQARSTLSPFTLFFSCRCQVLKPRVCSYITCAW